MAKNLWKDLPNNWKVLSKDIIDKTVELGEDLYKKPLEGLVAPFVTQINFEVTENLSDGNYSVFIAPKPNEFTTNRASGAIETATLFKYLDEGTEQRFAVMPNDFQNETFPGTLNSVAARYNRSRIFLSNVSVGKVEGRRWLEVLEKMQKPKLRSSLNSAVRKSAAKINKI